MDNQIKFREIMKKGIDLNILEDISFLLEDKSNKRMSIANALTEKMLEGYIIPHKGLTKLVTLEIAKVYEVFKEKSSDIIVGAMFEEINGRIYAVGVNTLITRLSNEVENKIE